MTNQPSNVQDQDQHRQDDTRYQFGSDNSNGQSAPDTRPVFRRYG